MSQTLADLIQVAVAGRYKLSVWGIVPMLRRVRRMPPGTDPEQKTSIGYARFARCVDNKRPIGYPVGSHGLKEVESHLRALGISEPFECAFGLELIARQADAYIGTLRHSHKNANPAMILAAEAFRDIWIIVNSRMSDTCWKCADAVKKRLALNGFVT